MLEQVRPLLERQEEFARSRLKLQARYHHVLVDEFQDTSRLQWRLVELLVDAWGEGEGAADAPTSIFVVGDRKQSIYRFRHAEVTLLDEAARKIGALRPGRPVRQVITTSFRAVPELLAFVNALSDVDPERLDAATIGSRTASAIGFPCRRWRPARCATASPCWVSMAEPSMASLRGGRGRRDRSADRLARSSAIATGRRGRPGPTTSRSSSARAPDISTSRRRSSRAGSARTSTRASDSSTRPRCRISRRSCAILAQPESDLRAAEFLRSRFVRMSDPASCGWRRRSPARSARPAPT